MVRPRYIICSEGHVIDRATNLITHYKVIDAITIGVATPAPDVPVLVGITIHLSAVWARENDSEKNVEYETEVRIFPPGSPDEPSVIRPGNFRFGEHLYHRVNVVIQPGPPGGAEVPIKLCDGVLCFECRIRPAHGGEWLSQEYPIPFKVKRLDSPPPE